MTDFLSQPAGKTLEFKRDLSSPKPLLPTLVEDVREGLCAWGQSKWNAWRQVAELKAVAA